VEALWADFLSTAFWVGVGKIIVINIILSGDNAVVIALACRMLPAGQRLWGMILGAGVAVVLRVIFTVVVAEAMTYQFLKLVGGALLLWVAVKLVVPEEEEGEGKVAAADNLWRAVRIVAIADIVMSLDNVIAIAAAAESAAALVDLAHASAIKATLIIFGLATSVPLIIAGSALLMALLDRYPILVWAGAGLLGWVAGDIMVKDDALNRVFDPGVVAMLQHLPTGIGQLSLNLGGIAGTILVIGTGWMIRRARHRRPFEHPLIVDPPGPEEFPHRSAEAPQPVGKER
jgi:YjbE family integral membrane protein